MPTPSLLLSAEPDHRAAVGRTARKAVLRTGGRQQGRSSGRWRGVRFGVLAGIVATGGGFAVATGNRGIAEEQVAESGGNEPALLGEWPPTAGGSVVGAAVCAGCHGEIVEAQAAHPMARTAAPVGPETADRWFGPERLAGAVEWRGEDFAGRERVGYERTVEGAALRGPDGDAPVSTVFGSGLRGSTPVSFLAARRMRELRVSWSHGRDRWIETPGSETDADPLGDEDPARETDLCLGCHATAIAWNDGQPELLESEWGVRCERCHGPGAAHAAGWESGTGGAIFNPGLLSAREQVGFCAQCHRNPTDFEPLLVLRRDRSLVRHAGASLMMSACFRESPAEATITCLDCHDPHRSDTEVRAASRATCRRCHRDPAAEHRYERVTAASDCVRCHLPTREEVFPGADFTDHWIRVDGAPPALDSPSAQSDLGYLEVLYRNELAWPSDARREGRLRIALGELLHASGLYSAAFDSLERGLEAEPRYEDLLKAAAIYRAESDLGRAVEILERATEEGTDTAHAFFDLGDLYLYRGEFAEAIVALERAAYLRPTDSVIRDRLAVARRRAQERNDPGAVR